MFMLNVCVRWCAFLMFAPFLTARCQYFLLLGANIKLSDERRLQMELEEEKPINLRLRKKWGCHYIFALTQYGFPCFISMSSKSMGSRNVPYIQYQSILIPNKSNQKHFKLPIKLFNVFNLTALSPHEYQPLFSYKWTWTLDSAKLPTRS